MATNDAAGAPVILNIPFNGSAVDTGPNAAAVQLTGAQYVPSRTGDTQAVRFPGSGRAEIRQQFIPLSGAYTFSFWVKAEQTGVGPTATWMLVKFKGLNNFLYLDFANDLTSWTYVVIAQASDRISLYVNSRAVAEELFPPDWGKPTGFCVLNDNPSSGSGYNTLEDVSVVQGATTGGITLSPLPQMNLNYYVAEQNFVSFGVYVSDSDGIIDNLTMKDPFSVQWDDYHGEVIDLTRPRYQPRDITLSCFIQGVGKDEFLDRVKLFLAQFQRAGTVRLRLMAHSTKPLVYEVYLKDSVALKKKWSDSLMVGTFELKLREPEPVKRVLLFSGAGTVNITLSSAKMLNIYWGDVISGVPQVTRDVYGTAKTVSHTYTDSLDHYIIIAGVIEDIYDFSTTGMPNPPTIIWNKL